MRKGIAVLAACLFASLLVLANGGGVQTNTQALLHGFSVEVLPDEEFDDFVQCGVSMFTLADEEALAELPALRIMAGDSNSMMVAGLDGVEIEFKCGVSADMSEATYAIEGRRQEKLVLSHLATIRLK